MCVSERKMAGERVRTKKAPNMSVCVCVCMNLLINNAVLDSCRFKWL